MTRNGIVSGMQYVPKTIEKRFADIQIGILFLTTNRVGTIDEAFKSRIHVSLFYPKLDRKTTLKIWETNLSRVKADIEGAGRRVKYNEKDILQFAKTHFRELKNMDLKSWNGRQIRNAFQTVVALADYKSKGSTLILHRSHFEKVAEASKEFDEYLTEVYQGQTESKRAERERSRFDDYPDRPRGDLPPAYTTQRRTGAATRRRRAKPTKEETDNDTDESDESDESVHESDISSECSEDEPAKPAKTRSRGKQKRTSPEESETTSNNNNDDDDDDDDDGDDDKQPAVAKMSKNKKTKSGLGKKASRK
ncbi:MAG: hypothetical protein M1813_008789 [Trichoglossum hirsutum]|nr:MAG: hypothetical protein M1813_008789 [Trichoglossum hirsutum]